MDKPLRIDVGCGENLRPGYVGCDIRQYLAWTPYVCRAWELSEHVDPGTVDEIYSRHMLEHLTFKEGEAALRDWYKCLKPYGKIEVIVPNVITHINQFLDGENGTIKNSESDRTMLLTRGASGIWGWQRQGNPETDEWDERHGDVHKSGYTTSTLKGMLSHVGYQHVSVDTSLLHVTAVGFKIGE